MFDVDFIIVPKYVFKPLSKWYTCNKVIERSVNEIKIFQNIMRSKKNIDPRQQSLKGTNHYESPMRNDLQAF